MKALWFAGAVMLTAVSAVAQAAQPEGPRASSENNWPGMSDAVAAVPALAGAEVPAAAAPHYVWQQGYEHGKWHGHWVLVQ